MKKLLFIFLSLNAISLFAQSLSSLGGPNFNKINTILNYNDSVLFVYKKDIGFYKTTDLGNNWNKIEVDSLFDNEITGLVKHINGDIFASTTSAGLIRSTDIGNTWISTSTSQFGVISPLFAKANGNLFIGGETSGLYKSSDLGQNWTNTGFQFRKVKALTESAQGTLFACADNLLYRSTNEGVGWFIVLSDVPTEQVFLTKDNFNAVYIASKRYFKRSFDQGLTWSNVGYVDPFEFPTTVVITDDSLIYKGRIRTDISDRGGISKSSDYGKNFSIWGLNFQDVTHSLLYNNQYLIAASNTGLYKNTIGPSIGFSRIDNGIKQPVVTDLLTSFASASFAEVVAVSDSIGMFSYKLVTGWQPLYQNFPYNRRISTAYIKNIALIGTKEKGLWRTSNNGQSWNQVNLLSNNDSEIFTLKYKDDNWILCATKNDGIFISTDQGVTWNISSNGLPQSYSIKALDVTSEGLCFLSTNDKGLFSSTDGGIGWINLSQNFPDTSQIVSISIYFNFVLAATKSNGLYRSVNFGIDWEKITNGLPPTIQDPIVKFHSSSYAYLSGETFIYYSMDMGQSWMVKYAIPSNIRITSVAFNNNSFLYFGADNGIVYRGTNTIIPVELTSFTASSSKNTVYLNWSTASELNNYGFEIERSNDKADLPDGKAGWRTIGFREGKGTTTEQQNYSYTDDLFGVNAHKLYYRLKQIDYDGQFEYSNVLEVNVASMNFALHQNYPNPFNPSTVIGYQLPVSADVTLKVFGVLGREVATLVNEYREAGYHEVEFQSSVGSLQLASGIYYYQLKAGSYLQTKKMIFLK
jgi:photosystem II stability/assembly factor-like uncharacterized protein